MMLNIPAVVMIMTKYDYHFFDTFCPHGLKIQCNCMHLTFPNILHNKQGFQMCEVFGLPLPQPPV